MSAPKSPPKSPVKRKSNPARGGRRKNSGGARPGAGRPRRATPAERDAIERARSKGRSALPELIDLALEATKATKVEFVKDEGGFTPVGDVPDWPVRLRAAQFIADRCGMPPEAKVDAPTASAALTALLVSLADGLDPAS